MSRLVRERDNQQWILDYLVMSTGRDRNFGVDHHLWPQNVVRNHRMVPRVMTRIGEDYERLARESDGRGHVATASKLYFQAVQAFRAAQHAIMATTDEKRWIYGRLNECYDRVIALSSYPIERVEIPWEGGSLPALFHHAADSEHAPTVLFCPGMDATKEDVPDPGANIFLQRGMNVLVLDGPGQGESNIRGHRATDDNYERAGAAAIDWLVDRPEVDSDRIGVIGLSMGSFWSLRVAAHDQRVKAVVSAMGCWGDKRYIFDIDSPHFKQMFMYMAGLQDEEQFDAMAARMTLEGFAERVSCPTLLAGGEFDPLAPLEDMYDVFERLGGPKEVWVLADEVHRLHWVQALGGLSIWLWALDWLADALGGALPRDHCYEVYVEKGVGGPFSSQAGPPRWRTSFNGVAP